MQQIFGVERIKSYDTQNAAFARSLHFVDQSTKKKADLRKKNRAAS